MKKLPIGLMTILLPAMILLTAFSANADNFWTCVCGRKNGTKYCTACGRSHEQSEAERIAAEATPTPTPIPIPTEVPYTGEVHLYKVNGNMQEMVEDEELKALIPAEGENYQIGLTITNSSSEEITLPIKVIVTANGSEKTYLLEDCTIGGNRYKTVYLPKENSMQLGSHTIQFQANNVNVGQPFSWTILEPTPTPTPTPKAVAVGDYVTFGTYPQTKAGNDSTPIEWLVLDVQDGKALLISRYALDCQPYNSNDTDVTWETCTLHTWLNGEFIKNAFNTEEQRSIVKQEVDNSQSQCNSSWNTKGGNNTDDQVFLLSYAEANKYFKNNAARACKPTAYVEAQNANKNSHNGNCWWWLRSPGFFQYSAAHVNFDGSCFYNFVDDSIRAVRPAIWVDLSSGIF